MMWRIWKGVIAGLTTLGLVFLIAMAIVAACPAEEDDKLRIDSAGELDIGAGTGTWDFSSSDTTIPGEEPNVTTVLGKIQSVELRDGKMIVVTLHDTGRATLMYAPGVDQQIKIPYEFTFAAKCVCYKYSDLSDGGVVLEGTRTGTYEGARRVSESWTFPDDDEADD